jgi:hypothetical protein
VRATRSLPTLSDDLDRADTDDRFDPSPRGEIRWPRVGRSNGHQRGIPMATVGELPMAAVICRPLVGGTPAWRAVAVWNCDGHRVGSAPRDRRQDGVPWSIVGEARPPTSPGGSLGDRRARGPGACSRRRRASKQRSAFIAAGAAERARSAQCGWRTGAWPLCYDGAIDELICTARR